jgi:hypothetical protein
MRMLRSILSNALEKSTRQERTNVFGDSVGSNRKKFNVNTTNIYNIFYTNTGGLKCFQSNFQSFYLST